MDPVSRAQNSEPSEKRRSVGRPFPKGVSGNPGGRPKKLHITKMYEKILANSVNRKEIQESLMQILTGGRMASVLMLREMAERTEGKIAQTLDVEVSGHVTLEQVAEARKRAGK
jgi:Family of unknown function (DUF5681)